MSRVSAGRAPPSSPFFGLYRERRPPQIPATTTAGSNGAGGHETPGGSMKGHGVVAIAIATLLVAGVHTQALSTEAQVDWAVNATIIDGCSCRMLCPCIFGSPATVGSAATHEHTGHRSCYFNAAFQVNKGHYGAVALDGLKFGFAGDKGDAKTVELTFEPSATREQRAAIRVCMSHFLPLKWTSFAEGPDATIDWKADAVRAEARLDGGK